jgi:hypothetical protein
MYKESLSFGHIRHMDSVLTLTFDFLILSLSAYGMTNDLTLMTYMTHMTYMTYF